MIVQLDDGTTVRVARRDVNQLYDKLWAVAPKRGAITAAGKLQFARMMGIRKITLDPRESAAFRAAIASDLGR